MGMGPSARQGVVRAANGGEWQRAGVGASPCLRPGGRIENPPLRRSASGASQGKPQR